MSGDPNPAGAVDLADRRRALDEAEKLKATREQAARELRAYTFARDMARTFKGIGLTTRAGYAKIARERFDV